MKSLSRALFVYILVGVSLVLLASGAAVFGIARASLRARFDEGLVSRARTFASLVIEEPGSATEEGEVVFEYFGSLREADLGVLLRITTGEGKVVAESPEWSAVRGVPRVAPAPGGAALHEDRTVGDKEPARGAVVAALATRDPEDVHSAPPTASPKRTVIVEVIGRTAPLRRTESALLGALLPGALLGAAGAALAVWFGVKRGLSPLRRLGAELAGIDPRKPAMTSDPAGYPEELRPVVAALDGLLGRLRAVMERERRFTDAAAHELRTPIAELRMIVDVALRWPDEARLRRSLAESGVVAEEMAALLEVLLAAARGGEAYASQAPESVALLPLAREIAARETARIEGRRVAWEFLGDEAAAWMGPKAAIVAIVRNLVQNAAAYTPDTGAVRVSVERDNGSAILEVENGPVGIEAADVERMFEPFWRADGSRSDREHRGLGLSIVASLCESLKLQRQASVLPTRRFSVRVWR